MSIITLNQLVDWFEEFSTNHYFLNDFGFGETYDVGTSVQMKFPYLWLSLGDTGVIGVSNKTAIPTISFNVMIVDKINQQTNYQNQNGFNSDNAHEIFSDTLQTIQDLVVYIQTYWVQYGVMLNTDVNFFPVVDETPDKIYGFMGNFNLTLRVVNCDIPISPVNPVSPTTTTTTTIPITPTITPTPTETPNPVYQYFTAEITGLTQQEVLVECFDTFWNIGPGNNLCNWTGEVLITGSTGTVVSPTFTFPIGQQNYTIDLSGSLLPGEIVSNISCCWNVSIPCPNYWPQFISTPISPTPTPTLTPTPTQP